MAARKPMNAEAIVKWAESDAHSTAPAGNKRLSPEQVAHIQSLRRINPDLTQAQIAEAVGTTQSTVSRWLQALEHDTTEDAKQLYAASQLKVAATVLDKLDDADGKVALKAAEIAHKVGKLLDDKTPQTNVGVQVVIGMPGQPAGPDPLQVVATETVTATEPS